jgi:hypothetical protein
MGHRTSCPAFRAKIFRLTRRANQRYQLARLTRQEGRLAIVTNVRWDAVDANAATDERSSTRTAKSCGPGAPMLALSLVDRASARRRWQESPVTEESTKETVKPSRRESRIASAGPVCSCAFLSHKLHTRPRVQRAPGFPCALRSRGREEIDANLGRFTSRECYCILNCRRPPCAWLRAGAGDPVFKRSQ